MSYPKMRQYLADMPSPKFNLGEMALWKDPFLDLSG